MKKIAPIPELPVLAEHGGDLEAFSARTGRKISEILDFSSNTNPFELPGSCRAIWEETLGDLGRYPEPYSHGLRQKIGKHFEVPCESVLAGNGSLSLLQIAMRLLKPGSVLLAEPGFGEYRRLAAIEGARIMNLSQRPEDAFSFPEDDFKKQMCRADLAVLSQPSSPTGSAIERPVLESLVERARRYGTFVILDEAFCDWTPELSLASRAGTVPNLLVVRSFTKFFPLAGIRSGYALGPKAVIAAMEKLQGPWACNLAAQRLSAALLEDFAFQAKSREWFAAESGWFWRNAAGLEPFSIFPSRAPFFLMRCRKDFEGFFEALESAGIFVRRFGPGSGLGPDYFRVGLRTRPENSRLIKFLKNWGATGKPGAPGFSKIPA